MSGSPSGQRKRGAQRQDRQVPMRPNGKAVIEGETEGFAKIVGDAERTTCWG